MPFRDITGHERILGLLARASVRGSLPPSLIFAGPEGVAAELKRRYGGIVDRCSFYAPYRTDPERWTRVIDDLKSA